jgi:PiT family inorganic phosphate transporter
MSLLPVNTTVLVVIALAFGVFNGLNDASSVVATVISTRAVATTIGQEVVAPEAVTLPVIFAALLSAMGWTAITRSLGIPSSTSHALIGGIGGAVWIGYGLGAIQMQGFTKILAALFLSPVLGLIAGYWLVRLTYFLTRGATPHVNVWFKRGQLLAAVTLALAHGTNDAQKTMGMIALGLVATGRLTTFHIPAWVILTSAAAMGTGTLFGGWNLIRTLGAKFYRVRPIHGFDAQIASSAIVLGAALLGGPVSTTHVVSSAIVGAGSADRVQQVRWTVFEHIITSWLLTIPASAALGALLYELLRHVV